MIRKEEISLYEDQKLDDILLTAGRILISNNNEVDNASHLSPKEVIEKANEFFNERKDAFKKLLCKKHRDKIAKLDSAAGNWIELIGYLSAILESSSLSFGPFNYLFISIWIAKNGITKLCD